MPRILCKEKMKNAQERVKQKGRRRKMDVLSIGDKGGAGGGSFGQEPVKWGSSEPRHHRCSSPGQILG